MNMPAGPYPPTTELVAVAWVRRAFELAGFPDQPVGTTLPKDVTGWLDSGFVQVQVVGGAPDTDIPVRRPMVQVDGWATTAKTGASVPWFKANRLVELVRLATEDAQLGLYGKSIDLGKPEYRNAAVQAAYPMSEPTRMTGDPSSFARFTMDLAIDWKPVAV